MNAITALQDTDDDAFPSFRLADCITSGLYGRELREALHRHFPDTPRAAVYAAIAIAWSMAEADLLMMQAERDEALRRLAAAGAQL